MEAIHPAEPLPASQLAAALPALAQQWADRSREPLQPAGALGDAAVAKARSGLVTGGRHHGALEPLCGVVLAVVCHGRAIPLLWTTLEHPSASVSAEVVITLLAWADRAFPSAELLCWFEGQSRWRYVMRL